MGSPWVVTTNKINTGDKGTLTTNLCTTTVGADRELLFAEGVIQEMRPECGWQEKWWP